MVGKPDFPGLLRAGFHALTLEQIRELCVVPFELSTTRASLWANLGTLFGRFEACGIRCDFWVDGSFVTQKIDPNDIDLVARLPAAYYNERLDSEVGEALEWFAASADELNIDAYHFPEHEDGSPLRVATEERLAYWEDLFRTGRDNTTEKGIIVVNVNGGAT